MKSQAGFFSIYYSVFEKSFLQSADKTVVRLKLYLCLLCGIIGTLDGFLQMCIRDRQGGIRPVLIIQNDVGNRHSPTVICAAITSKMNKAKLPTHIEIDASAYGIEKDSVILLEQLRTIDKRRLKDKVCHLDGPMLDKVNHALEISLELTFS